MTGGGGGGGRGGEIKINDNMPEQFGESGY